MIITIAGEPGAGKTTLSKRLSEHFGWPEHYVGAMRRDAAKKRGMTLEEYNKLGEKDPITDKEVDEWQKELGKKEDDFIIQGRTSWYFIPQSIKIYMKVDPQEGAKRIFKQLECKEREGEVICFESVEDVLKLNQQRVDSDNVRYRKYYGIEAYDEKNFDFVIDTTNKSVDETFKEVLQFIEPKLKK